jgi:hypothetical protein
MSDTKQAALVSKMERVYTESGAHIATVWAEHPSEDRLPGESWPKMRERTEPDRIRATQQTYDRARLFAAAPDLLAVCIEALENDEACEGFNNANMDEGLRAKIRAAIEKATNGGLLQRN